MGCGQLANGEEGSKAVMVLSMLNFPPTKRMNSRHQKREGKYIPGETRNSPELSKKCLLSYSEAGLVEHITV
jgi:hypothetical protein